MTRMIPAVTLGATYLNDGHCSFCVWAPLAQQVEVHIVAPRHELVPMKRHDQGYHQAIIQGVQPGSRYYYRLDGSKERPDPASRFQPEGVHGPSQVVNPCFAWDDDCWFGLLLRDYVLYELHVGTFTPEGTFDAIIPRLDALAGLGITAVELMPVSQFPGNRNWGYDSVFPFAVQDSYGGPEGLKRLVNACHRKGLAVVLDVVYNHLGPEGNCLVDYGPYLTHRYRTPWGSAINFDGPDSDHVRRYFIENALYWITEFHVDALRLDALHGIVDMSPDPFLKQLASRVSECAQRSGRRIYLIAESDLNDPRLARLPELGGYGLDALWNDDFHHSLHALLTGENAGYYQDFGCMQHLVKAFQQGFVYSGQYSAYRRRRHGVSSRDVPAERLVVFAQNHDQVGNRVQGERLSQIISFQGLKLAAAVTLLSPFIPLIFMGEEYGETAPFAYFVSHSDPHLVEAVRSGRLQEFAGLRWQGDPPDPQDEATFHRARLDHSLQSEAHHRALLSLYKELIRLRKELPPLAHLSKDTLEVVGYEEEKLLIVRRWCDGAEVVMAFNFGHAPTSAVLPTPAGQWRKQLDSADQQWHGRGSSLPETLGSAAKATITLDPGAFTIYVREQET